MRKNLETEKSSELELQEFVDSYGRHKDEMGVLKKECDLENLRLKQKLKELEPTLDGKFVCKTDNYTVVLAVQDKSTINEEKLLEFIKKNLSKTRIKALGLIKTREYVDETALEEAIYKGDITVELVAGMDSCKDVATTEVLRISKNK